MYKYWWFIIFFLFRVQTIHAQDASLQVSIKNYSDDQKRLLLKSTAQFIEFVTRGDLDRDTMMFMARRITGLPFHFSFQHSGDAGGSVLTTLIDSGKIHTAGNTLQTLKGEAYMQGVLELAAWYVFKPGDRQADLDSAYQLIDAGLRMTSREPGTLWEFEYRMLLGQYEFQNNNVLKSKEIFQNLADAAVQNGKKEMAARAFQQMGLISAAGDSAGLSYFEKSLELFQQLNDREHQIEILWNIADFHKHYEDQEQDMIQILNLQRAIGFRHRLFAQNRLAYLLKMQIKYLDGLKMADSAWQNMKAVGPTDFSGNILYRMASLYLSLGKEKEALELYRKGFENRSRENQYFWFTSFFNTAYFLRDMGKPEEALELIQKVTTEFPPISIWQQLMLISVKGSCYETLKEPKRADQTYMPLLKLTVGYPDRNLALADICWNIAKFYMSVGDLKKARLFIARASEKKAMDKVSQLQKYTLLYKVDSMEGNYKSALENHILFKDYNDTVMSRDQRNKLDELTVQYDAEKKDQDIRILKQKGLLQQAELNQNKSFRNLMIAGSLVLFIFLGLLYSRYLLKQKSNLQLQTLVAEKEFLMKEIHHRVKNNLQIVISLLNTQSKFLNNEEAIEAISESRHRMQTMSLIHQKLYQSENVDFVGMREYIQELVSYLDSSLNTNRKIKFRLEVDPIDLDIAQAIPVGLILNEAVTNCMKHAFTNQQEGTIHIRMQMDTNQWIVLEIRDNGKGLPADFDFISSQSLGIRLIRGLVEQIGGDLTFSDQNGCSILTHFKRELIPGSAAV